MLRKLRGWMPILSDEGGGQTIEWIALGMLIVGVLTAISAGMQADSTLGEKVLMALGRIIDKIAG